MTIRALSDLVAAWGGRRWLATGLTVLVFTRLRALVGRMERLVARFEAGRPMRRVGVVRADAAGSVEPTRGGSARVLPCGFAWLVRLMGYQAAGYGSQLRTILGTPEMVALLEASPQAGRLLRPLCRMLAVETALLRIPPRVSRRRPVVVVVDVGVMGGASLTHPTCGGRVIPLPRGVKSAARRQGVWKGG